jgi:cholesterol transport system auxiliary component
MMRQVIGIGVAALFAAMIASCSILPKAEPRNVYVLPATSRTTPSTASPVSWSLRINTPKASGVLDSDRIAVMPDASRITVYQGASWNDDDALLLRNHLVDAFRMDGRVAMVSNGDANQAADRELDGQLRSFQTEYLNGVPSVVIRYDAQLIDTRTRRMLATRSFEVHSSPARSDIVSVVNAFGAASDTLTTQVIAWVTGT